VDASRERAGESCRYNDPLDTDTFEIRGAGNASRDLVIRYGVRKSRNDRVVYQRPAHPDQVIHQVVASYDTFTVYADGAEYDSTRHRLRLRGNVLFDANGVRTTAAAATIDITPEDVVIRQRS